MKFSHVVKNFTKPYTKLVLFKIRLLTAPSPAANNAPPARHIITFTKPESSGVIIGIIVNKSIPAASGPRMCNEIQRLNNESF